MPSSALLTINGSKVLCPEIQPGTAHQGNWPLFLRCWRSLFHVPSAFWTGERSRTTNREIGIRKVIGASVFEVSGTCFVHPGFAALVIISPGDLASPRLRIMRWTIGVAEIAAYHRPTMVVIPRATRCGRTRRHVKGQSEVSIALKAAWASRQSLRTE